MMKRKIIIIKDGQVLQKAHRVIKYDQNPWLKECIETNTDLKEMQQVTCVRINLSYNYNGFQNYF